MGKVVTSEISFGTQGEVEIHDLTKRIYEKIKASGVLEGVVTVFVPGSTGAITTIEYEPGLLQDIPDALERLFPEGIEYGHDMTWHDGNGHSHVRAAFLGPSLTVPITDGNMMLGTWQQIVFIELDNKVRDRRVILQIMGE